MLEIPIEIGHNETIIRGIQSKRSFNPRTKQLKSNFFKLRVGDQGCSCIRLDYTTLDFAKYHCKSFENIEKGCRYVGFVSLKVREILSSRNALYSAIVKSTPVSYQTHDLLAHCDIEYGITINEGDPYPEELYEVFEMFRLVASNKIYLDPTPQSEKWEGHEII